MADTTTNTTTALEAEVAALKSERDTAIAALKKSGGPVPITGSYKGYRFADGHQRVRDAKGALCDTALLLESANNPAHPNHATACAVLDRLIQINYAYFTKDASPATGKKQ